MEHPMEQKFQQDVANRLDAEKWRNKPPDCRICTSSRSYNLFKGEYYCVSPVRCVDANRFFEIGHPVALWERRDVGSF